MAWTIASLFVLGLFISLIGAWTGAILGVWFVGTQKPWRGFLWMGALTLIFSPHATWHSFSLTVLAHGPARMLNFLGLVLLSVLLNVLPFTFHRLVSPRLPGFLSTLPFPLAVVALPALVVALHIGPASRTDSLTLFICWFAAVVVWMWNHEFRTTKIAVGAGIFVAVCVLAGTFNLFPHFNGATLPHTWLAYAILDRVCLLGVLILSVWALSRPVKQQTWAQRPKTVDLLLSPVTGNRLHVVSERGQETLVSTSGERFPVRGGIPAFLKPEDLTGDNGKYNHVYQVIGGFYDDIQRVFCALKGFDRGAYFRSYMRLVEVKPGDSVLETSAGTGLNFKYLPRGIMLSALDLSPEMLTNCQTNLRRWEMDADLYLGNAESLPFADCSFDVVFHVGGINFFNDRAKAIREMIRVAKPGSLLLIADETEKHVKEVYEKSTGGLFKNRKEPVSAPIDLVPPEMHEIHLEQLRNGDFYALTFRKPASGEYLSRALVSNPASIPCMPGIVAG
jgi:ubiquinone/menaquinone biosynthesis C-methylase UbiE